MEQQSCQGHIDLFYGDECQVSEEGYVPYGWQFSDEDVAIEVAKGNSINCFALLSRSNEIIYRTTEQTISADFVIEQFEQLSMSITKPTVIVLDNARIHTARKVKERIKDWQNRDLYVFYLPPYSPHLNIAERLWKELKSHWLKPTDYQSAELLFYSVDLALAAVGKTLFINFSNFNL